MKNPGIYILTSPSGKQYVGKDVNLPSRVKIHLSGKNPQCYNIHSALQKYGADAFDVEIIEYPHISHKALNAVERWKIRHLQTLSPSGYNLTEGGDGVIPSEETIQKIRENNKKRVKDGTHHFLGDSNPSHKRIADGTHNFLDGEFHETHRQAICEGRLRGIKTTRRRVESGTHHFLGDSNPSHKRAKDGTHHFLGDSNPSHKRVTDGTHNFLDGEISRRTQKKRLEDGTHNFLGETHPAKQRTLKRLKAEWCYIIALSRFWYEIHDYTLKRRSEFLSKDIPDMSNAEQEYLF